MGEILEKPDSPWVAFFKGMGWMAAGIGTPILAGVLFLHGGGSYQLWTRLGFGAAFVGVACLAAGVVRAVWALIQRWAYDRVTGDPFH